MVRSRNNRGVLLDRDGVINSSIIKNRKPHSPTNLDEFSFLPDVIESIDRLSKARLIVVVITNQPDISKGIITHEDLFLMNKEIKKLTRVDEIYTCIHLEEHECDCRKPKTGMLKRAAIDFDLDLKRSYLVGDRWRDIEAGQAAGCKCFFIDYEYAEMKPKMPYTRVTSLREVTNLILKEIEYEQS